MISAQQSAQNMLVEKINELFSDILEEDWDDLGVRCVGEQGSSNHHS